MKLSQIYSMENFESEATDADLGDKVLPIGNDADDEQSLADIDRLNEKSETAQLVEATESLRLLQQMIKDERPALESNRTALKFAILSYHQTVSPLGLGKQVSLESIHDVASLEAGILDALKKTWQSIKSTMGKVVQRVKDFKDDIDKDSRDISYLIKDKITELEANGGKYTFSAMVNLKALPKAIDTTARFIEATGKLKLKVATEFIKRLKSSDLKDTWNGKAFADEAVDWRDDVYRDLPGSDEALDDDGGLLGPFFFGHVLIDGDYVLGYSIPMDLEKKPKEHTFTASAKEIIPILKQIDELLLMPGEKIVPGDAVNEWMGCYQEIPAAIKRNDITDKELIDDLYHGANIVQYVIDHTAGMSAFLYCQDYAKHFLDSLTLQE